MTLKPIPCFTVVCDWPNCGADMLEEDDYSGYGEADFLREMVSDCEWHEGRDGASHYCDQHQTFWASDAELGDKPPALPYLLIHDGDTKDRVDDGKVSLICHELEDPRQQALPLGGTS